ncbi:MAG: hypothetical protein ACI4M3_00240 [Acutalibacteraceae bacterium]
MKKLGTVLYYLLGIAVSLLMLYHSGAKINPGYIFEAFFIIGTLFAIRRFAKSLYTDILILINKNLFKAVYVTVTDIEYDNEYGYYILVQPLYIGNAKKVKPQNIKYFDSKEDAKKLLGTRLALYARENDMETLFYEEDLAKSKTVLRIIGTSIGLLLFVALFLALSNYDFWLKVRDVD